MRTASTSGVRPGDSRGGVPAGSQRQLLILNKQTHHMAMGKLKSILSLMALIASGVAAASSPASAGDQCSVATMKGSYLYAQDGIILGTLPDKNKPLRRPVVNTLTARAACRGSILETLMESLLAEAIREHTK